MGGGRGDAVHANALLLLLRYFSNAAGCSVKPLLPLLVSSPFETSTMQQPRVFEAFQTKTSQLTLKINKNKKHEQHGICDTSAKTSPTNKTENHGQNKARNIFFFTKTTQNSGFSSF